MRTAGELSGLAVVGGTVGDRLGRVQDVLFDTTTGQVTGFLLKTGGLFSKPHRLLRDQVRSVGQDALVVIEGNVIEEVQGEPVLAGSESAHDLDGRPVLDSSGTLVGHVTDVLVDEEKMAVSALILSQGFFDKLFHGKPRISLIYVRAIGQDSVVLTPDFDPAAASPDAS